MISAVQTNILVLKEVASFEIDIEHLLIQNGLMKYFISLSSIYLQGFDSIRAKKGGCNIMIAFLLCFTPPFFFAQFEPNSLVVFIKKIIKAKLMFRANCFCNSLLVEPRCDHKEYCVQTQTSWHQTTDFVGPVFRQNKIGMLYS